MAPIKFEENIKDKLEKRTLSPAAESWSKLSERLDADHKKSKNPLFWWLSIAAGLIILVAISVQFFNANETEKLMPQVVEEEEQEKPLENKTSEGGGIKSIQLAIESPEIADEKEKIEVIKETQIIEYKKLTQKDPKVKTKLAEENSAKQEERLNEEVQNVLHEAMMKNVVAHAFEDLKTENTSVMDREVDSLLKLASKELFKDKLQKETSKIVDANALLLGVEDDMGQSFWSKVFDALKGSYETVKTAVAERNN